MALQLYITKETKWHLYCHDNIFAAAAVFVKNRSAKRTCVGFDLLFYTIQFKCLF